MSSGAFTNIYAQMERPMLESQVETVKTVGEKAMGTETTSTSIRLLSNTAGTTSNMTSFILI